MRITVITADADGETHFVDRELELVAQQFAPPSPCCSQQVRSLKR